MGVIMPVLTIRDVDETVKTAPEDRAKKEGISQSALARRLLAGSLGVKVRKRDLGGLRLELFSGEGLKALNEINRSEPCFTDEELDRMMEEKDQRIAGDLGKPAPKPLKRAGS